MSNDSASLDVVDATKPMPPVAGGPTKSSQMLMGDRGLQLSNMEQAFIFAKAVIGSGLAPKGITTPEQVIIIVQFGAELGLPPMSALQNITSINGRPTVWGDAVPGICNNSGLVEDYKQEMIGSIGSDDWGYRVTTKRKGRAEVITATFTVEKAKKAGLWLKAGPWSQYPDRMLLNRARTFAMRDAYPDVMRGLITTEEAKDHPEMVKNVTRSLDQIDGGES